MSALNDPPERELDPDEEWDEDAIDEDWEEPIPEEDPPAPEELLDEPPLLDDDTDGLEAEAFGPELLPADDSDLTDDYDDLLDSELDQLPMLGEAEELADWRAPKPRKGP